MSVRERLRTVITDNRLVAAVKSDSFRIISVIGFVALLMTVSAAGVLSGAGLFLLAMIEMDTVAVVGSSALLAVSLSIFLSCYLWLSG